MYSFMFFLFLSRRTAEYFTGGEAGLQLTPADQVLLQRTVKTQTQTGLVKY